MKTRLVTAATHSHWYFDDFMASARSYVGEPVVLGWGRDMPRVENETGHLATSNRKLKLVWMLEWLQEHAHEQTHVLFTDAWDCVFQQPLALIENVYKEVGAKFLVSSDSMPWPLHPKRFPRVAGTRYFSLNSGVWMAESEHALWAIRTMLDSFKDPFEDDQGIMQQAYVSGRYGIGVDHGNRLALTVLPGPVLNYSPFDYALDKDAGKVECVSTHTHPCVVHLNGMGGKFHKARMVPVAKEIFEFLRPHSSVVEHALDKREVVGASPTVGTNFKVFGVGLSRTGTTSLTCALSALHIPSVHFPWSHDEVVLHRGAADTSIAVGFEYLDAMYFGSKFILTIRPDTKAWLKSCEWLWNTHLKEQHEFHKRIHRAIYDTVEFDAEKFTAAYARHTERVLRYFKHRPEDLLVMDITAGDGWSKLCPFLDVPEPSIPFPNTNKSFLPK